MGIGADIGTFSIIMCKRGENGDFIYKREVNAFVEIPTKEKFVFNIMKDAKDEEGKPCVPMIEWKDQGVAYALGEAALKIAYSMDKLEVKRPMVSGCLNPKEKHAQQIMNIMIHSLIDNSKDKEILYYSIPANAVNHETDADYHNLVLKSMFDSFKDDEGHTVIANPINEGLAVIYAELGSKSYTGVGISCGGGMVNVCFAVYGNPVFQFSIVNSGDWIDKQAAKATGESIAFINREKMNINLLEPGDSLIKRAIKSQYEIMIQKTVASLKEELEKSGNKIRTDSEIDIVVAGGTSSPVGFDVLFSEAVRKANIPVKIGNIIRPSEPSLTVSRGCLIAAEAAEQE